MVIQDWIEKKNKETPKDLEGQDTSCEETIEHFERTPAQPTNQLCDKEIKYVETLLEKKNPVCNTTVLFASRISQVRLNLKITSKPIKDTFLKV